MKLKNLIFYFPNFSEGGVENVLLRLGEITYLKKKLKFILYLIKNQNLKF